jgi:hypothetical protein
MPAPVLPTLAISSWSVHRAIGILSPNAPGNDVSRRGDAAENNHELPVENGHD